MSQFEYIAVLISIIVGLALTQILRGIGRMVTNKDGPRPYWVHLAWTLYLFIYITAFWWWEFQLNSVTWSLPIYFVLITYATLLFFASLVVQPGNVIGVSSYKDYYYRNRHWFFGLLIAITLWDFVDTFSKSVSHVSDLGVAYVAIQTGNLIGSAVAMSTRNELYHEIFAIAWVLLLIGNLINLFFSIQ